MKGRQGRDPAHPSPTNTRTLRRYSNRRLYDEGVASYVTSVHVLELLDRKVAFVVLDTSTGKDITEPVVRDIVLGSTAMHSMPYADLLKLYRKYSR